MQIIIPMSGMGRRFTDAGYTQPKPLINVDGKPIIEHVVNLFPGETNFTFICNSIHLRETDMANVLKDIAPQGEIISIDPHKKGPVYAVLKIVDRINDADEVIVNYCDFSKYWDYNNFLQDTRKRQADGAIAAYKGFHPHMLGSDNYAFIRDKDRWMLQIKEKEPFTNNRMAEYASDGTYYFRKGAFVKKYFKQLIEKDINVNGEYYVSLVFNLLKSDGLSVSIYEIEHMLQWGTPRDLEEYQIWSNYFLHTTKMKDKIKLQKNSINMIPLAGQGKRFLEAGYKVPKPLITIDAKPMILQAATSLPGAERHIFVCMAEHLASFPLEAEIRREYPNAKIVQINKLTKGQACTCEIGLDGEDTESALLIGACDNGMQWDAEEYQSLLDDKKVDAIVWSFRRHPSSERNPQMYGWIKVDKHNNVLGVSVKKQISDDPYNDHAIVGTFYFRKARYFIDALSQMYQKNITVNSEFYVDSCINELICMGLKVKVFEVTDYICWGTPDDLKTFQYWQSFFHKCNWHPYHSPVLTKTQE